MFSYTEISFFCVMTKHDSTTSCRRFEGISCLSLHWEIQFNSKEVSILLECEFLTTGKLLNDVMQRHSVFIYRVTFLCLIDYTRFFRKVGKCWATWCHISIEYSSRTLWEKKKNPNLEIMCCLTLKCQLRCIVRTFNPSHAIVLGAL